MSWRYAQPSRMELSDHTTLRQLQRVLHYAVTPCRALPSIRGADYNYHDIHGVDCDEVYPGIFIGDAAAAKNKAYLQFMGISHVLNTAEGCRYGQVDTGHMYYRDVPRLRYMGFPMMDQPNAEIYRYFYVAAKFINNAITSGGKVLVHCFVGMSRSATCVLAYLMIYRRMTAAEAIRVVRLRRDIRPNDGFLQQLADLDNELKRKGLYLY